jgi:hypothetical protein
VVFHPSILPAAESLPFEQRDFEELLRVVREQAHHAEGYSVVLGHNAAVAIVEVEATLPHGALHEPNGSLCR